MNIDGNKPESVVNLTGNRNAVLATAWVCFAAGVSWLWSLVTGPVRDLPLQLTVGVLDEINVAWVWQHLHVQALLRTARWQF